jgi:hypothetical protein
VANHSGSGPLPQEKENVPLFSFDLRPEGFDEVGMGMRGKKLKRQANLVSQK